MTARPTKTAGLAFFFLLGALGCSGKSVNAVGDLNTPTAGSGAAGGTSAAAGAHPTGTAGGSAAGGSTGNSAAGSSAAGNSAAGSSAAGAGQAGTPGAIDGTWGGYIENYKNSDLTDTVEVRISQGGLVGLIVFGAAMPPPPATDPQADYPPPSDANTGSPVYASGPDPGFVFTLMSSSFNGTRLQFDVSPNELYQTWCALQTPYKDDYNTGDNYFCVPNWGYASDGASCWQIDPKTMAKIARSCAQLRLCTSGTTCACTSTSCAATLAPSVHFDLMVALPKADGSVVGLDGNAHNVHLTKQ